MGLLDTLVHIFHPRRSNNHRSRILHARAFSLLAAVSIGFGTFIVASPVLNPELGFVLGYASDIRVEDVISRINVERTQAGLPALSTNALLSSAAQAKAADMFARQYWAHTSPEGTEPWWFINQAGYPYTSAGENLARDFMHTEPMVAAWMASPTHRANVLSEKYQETGVAVMNGVLDGVETTLVVQMFGKPRVVASAGLAPSVAANETPPDQGPTPVSEESPITITVSESPEEAEFDPDNLDSDQNTADISESQTLNGKTELTSKIEHSIVSPLQLTKAFGISLTVLLGMTLVYDEYIAGKNHVVRRVGKNWAHFLFLLGVGIVIVLFQGGFIG